MKQIRRILSGSLLCLLLCCEAIPALATETDLVPEETARPTGGGKVYEAVRVDNFTGVILEEDEDRFVRLTESCSYDTERKQYVFYIDEFHKNEVFSTVPDGATIQTTAALEVSDQLKPVLYRGGERIETPDFTEIKAPGAYSLTVEYNEIETRVLSFTILGTYAGGIYELKAPRGFRILDAACHDRTIAYSDDTVPLRDEGKYTVAYGNSAISERFELSFTVDNTPPELTLEGVEEGAARGPVTIQGISDGDRIQIYYEKRKASFSTVLATPGDYQIIIEDEAGNSSEYSFTIRYYLTATTWSLLAAVIGLLVLYFGYIFFKRKKFRSN